MDFPTLLAELQYWTDPANISQHFGWNYWSNGTKSYENGIDIGLPLDTPVYAILSGRVLGAGYYGGGGVVSTQADPTHSLYYQHLDQLAVSVGQFVQQGQLIGWSGGQLVGGHHPSTPKFSTGPHIEVGINAPFGGMWDPLGPNIDPLPYLKQLLASGGSVGTFGGGGGSVPSDPSNPSGGTTTGPGPLNPASWGMGLLGYRDLAWRGLLIFLGVALLLIAVHGIVEHAEDEEAGTAGKTAVPAAPATVTVAEAE